MEPFLTFELEILGAVQGALCAAQRVQFAGQLASVNRVQRLLDWRTIELYSIRWFRVRWPAWVLFSNTDKFEIASGVLNAPTRSASVTIWAVGGHIFSLESTAPLKPFASETEVSFTLSNSGLLSRVDEGGVSAGLHGSSSRR